MKLRSSITEIIRLLVMVGLENHYTEFEIGQSSLGTCDEQLSNSIDTCNAILNIKLPKKKKYVRRNQSTFVNKTLS